jgi:hypothetical protein
VKRIVCYSSHDGTIGGTELYKFEDYREQTCSKKFELTFIAVTSPVESGLVKGGPSPPDETVSTKVNTPLLSTVKDCRSPVGFSLTALEAK